MGAKPRDPKWYKRLAQLFAMCGSTKGDGANARAMLVKHLADAGLTWNDLYDALAEAKRLDGEEAPRRPEPKATKPSGDILKQIMDLLHTYIDVKDHERLVIALWVLHTYLVDQFTETPRLMFISAFEGEGKTTTLNILNKMIVPSIKAASFTAAALADAIDKDEPTLLLDEGRNLDLQRTPLMRAILHSGHERGGVRMVMRNNERTPFKTFAPLCITAIEELPSFELMSRAIIIRLRRSLRDDIKKFHPEDTTFDAVYDNIHQWGAWAKRTYDLRNADPKLPNLKNRRKDNWRPLIAIAEALGKGEEAREAMAKFDGRYEQAPGITLLRDIKMVMGDKRAMHSKVLADELAKIETSPWSQWRGKDNALPSHPITRNDIATLLSPVQIRPRSVEIAGVNLKGYHRDDFRDVWAAYCPDDPKDDAKVVNLQSRRGTK